MDKRSYVHSASEESEPNCELNLFRPMMQSEVIVLQMNMRLNYSCFLLFVENAWYLGVDPNTPPLEVIQTSGEVEWVI
jgi:hypothetical protein